MPIGTVKFFNDSKGYGFIQPDDGGNDAFVHVTALERAGMRSLQQNQRVSYDLEQDRRGKTSAVNLQNADDAAPQQSEQSSETQPFAILPGARRSVASRSGGGDSRPCSGALPPFGVRLDRASRARADHAASARRARGACRGGSSIRRNGSPS